ncbi:sigma-E factor negative regulatory protein [Herbaspirillum sp. GCM10030257]|uniref:sigma-E factor negative regulatory protein n=1 Tax=Herbaspirillum sp. GCM10030257 TaxID=3273393 RepID=UPI00361F92C2
MTQKQGWRNLNGVGMNTNEMSGEKISALADGEITDEQLDLALAAMKKDNACADWALYHQIGDVLRSSDMAINMSSDFSARFAARLQTEPTVIAPTASITRANGLANGDVQGSKVSGQTSDSRSTKRWALPGMAAAAAMAAVAFVATPQLMVAMHGNPISAETSIASASTDKPSAADSATVTAASASGEVVMRDPRIDDYLFAHQRFSPSLYSTAQYARSATFATESTK